MKGDALGDRIKSNFESRTRYYLPRRTYTIVRVDGKAFHSYTRGCDRPYDAALMQDMDLTAAALCEAIQGAKLAYVQSDEISILITDFEGNQTEAWFDGNIQKMASISASIATASFNALRWARSGSVDGEMAFFDSRIFTIPDPAEVENYFIWRQQDATRNSISMAAHACFPHDELEGVSSDHLQEMLWSRKGINWNDYPEGCKRGRCVVHEKTVRDAVYIDKRTGEEKVAEGVERYEWIVVAPPVFTKAREWLKARIPKYM